jgi:hypothetical protein
MVGVEQLARQEQTLGLAKVFVALPQKHMQRKENQ